MDNDTTQRNANNGNDTTGIAINVNRLIGDDISMKTCKGSPNLQLDGNIQQKCETSTKFLTLFADEIWFHVACYLDTLADFVRLWSSSSALVRCYEADHPTFWISLVRYYCSSRGLHFEELSASLGISFADYTGALVEEEDEDKKEQDTSSREEKEAGKRQPSGGLRGVHKNKNPDMGIKNIKRLFALRKCSRSGCYKKYREWDNQTMGLQCLYHPGKLRPTGVVSCCRGKGFQSTGCKAARHDGLFYTMVHMRRAAQPPSNTKPAEAVVVATPAEMEDSARASATKSNTSSSSSGASTAGSGQHTGTGTGTDISNAVEFIPDDSNRFILPTISKKIGSDIDSTTGGSGYGYDVKNSRDSIPVRNDHLPSISSSIRT